MTNTVSELPVVLVSGASGDIGGATARRLAASGFRVYAGYCRHTERAASLVAEIRAAGGQAAAQALDLADPAVPEQVCECIFRDCGRLDMLVNCAGLNLESPALAMEDDVWNRVLELNLSAAFRLCRAAAKFMLVRGAGRIVNVSSVAATLGGRGQINYAAAKAGLEAMTRVLALELGRKGILVNAVAPGVIEGAMSARLRREHGDAVLNSIAVRRFGTPEEVAGVIAFLLADDARYITGQVLHVDGGMGL